MTPAMIAILSEHRKHLPTMPSLKDLVPEPEMTLDEALLTIRKARAQILCNGAKLTSEAVTQLSREIREVCEELDQVRRLLMRDSEGWI